MIKEIAVDPEVLADWNGYRLVYEGCGVEKGRLISRFPISWREDAYNCVVKARCESRIQPVKAKSVIEKIKSSFDRRSIPCQRPFDGRRDWLENAEAQHSLHPFSSIIGLCNPRSNRAVLVVDDIEEDAKGWKVATGRKVERRAECLADCARMLLLHGERVRFVDPHFDPTQDKYRNTLRCFLHVCAEAPLEGRRIELHTKVQRKEIRKGEWREESESAWKKGCQSLVSVFPKGVALTLYRWRDDRESEGFHARYILTERGGIRFDWGLDEGYEGKMTDVQLLDESLFRERWEDFNEATTLFHLDSKITIICNQE